MEKKEETISLRDNPLAPVPINLTINHVDSKSDLNQHIDSDCLILTANLAMLMHAFPQLGTLSEICNLSDQVMKVLHKRRELCLKPTCIAEDEDSDINVTPVR
jgi:hypothetical protein